MDFLKLEPPDFLVQLALEGKQLEIEMLRGGSSQDLYGAFWREDIERDELETRLEASKGIRDDYLKRIGVKRRRNL